ncbi:MAG: capsule assembly Wzi family protein [Bacteroidetes bacterium]|nr:capsule assembly Wzi family protein [Bacteroidota bacterium]MBU1484488.1 capsule assembly Wzi family protein [Bacteroidota bacterium]MBU2267463.1 capsule assembly Wzi family protein [Bacteroidota bacterium]MBU2375210.1 capsule assembly Wzi family protein [Bacteroidota bacterium]
MKKINIYSFLIFIFICPHIYGQTINVGSTVEDYYQFLQLKGELDSSLSFTIRPLNDAYLTQAIKPSSRNTRDSLRFFYPLIEQKHLSLSLLPITLIQQVNTDHPYGWNDGAMIPAKGYESLVSAGFYFKVGPLSIQLQPEYVYAQNLIFDDFGKYHSDQDLINYYAYHSGTDQPEKFGPGSYSKVSWGQSNISLSHQWLSLSLSNENKWWGPGNRNSLIMGNHAPGFKNISLHSNRPINIGIGSLEFEMFGGRLEESNQSALVKNKTNNGSLLYNAKNPDWRYLSALTFSYQPKWVPGLFFGLTRTFQAYHATVDTFQEYVPFLTPYQKKNTNNGDPIPRDQLSSVYAKWLLPKTHAEVYFEYGVNDNAIDFRDFLGSPQHSRAYIFGFKKMIALNKRDEYITISSEITQLSQTPDRLVRPAGSWYYHGELFQGYTNKGQVLGAGTGSGGDLQSFSINYLKDFKNIGFRFERSVHDQDYYEALIGDYNGQSRRWVDLSFAALGQWKFNHFLLNTELNYIKSLNYQWYDFTPSGNYLPVGQDRGNFHGRIGINYFF